LAKKKEKVVTLRMDEESFKTVEDYAKSKGISVSAYITSVLDSYTEWFIPLASNNPSSNISNGFLQCFVIPCSTKIFSVFLKSGVIIN
jgi:hypothetical protein